MLSLLLSRAGVVAIAGLVVFGGLTAGGVALLHLRAEVGRLRATSAIQAQQLDQAQAVNATNIAQLNKLKADAARALAAVRADRDALAARAARLAALQEEVSNAPTQDDGPVAPVLGRTLERLRERPAATPGH